MIEMVGNPQLLAEGQALTKLQAENFLRPELEQFGKAVVLDAAIYPAAGTVLQPKRSGTAWLLNLFSPAKARAPSKYQRTGNLGQSWRQSMTGLDVKVENLATYAGYVMGPKQPYTWRYGWRRLQNIMADTMDFWILKMEHDAFSLWERS